MDRSDREIEQRQSILVTGASGRVGELICPRLRDLGWTVVGVDRRPSPDVIEADCLDVERMAHLCHGVSGIIHLAGVPDASPGWPVLRRMNIDATMAMLDAAVRSGVRRFVYASSIHAVGALPVTTPFHSDILPAPSGLYGASKVAAEALTSVYAQKRAISAVNVRICTLTPKPRNARELKTWLSPDDAAHLFDRALSAPISGCLTVWGVSENVRAQRLDRAADILGYRPRSNAEVFADHLAGAGVDISGLGPWDRLGGRQFDEDDLSGVSW